MSDTRLYRVDYLDDEGNEYNFIIPEDSLSDELENVTPPIAVLLSSMFIGELLSGYCVFEVDDEDDPGGEDLPVKLVVNGGS